MDIFDRLKAAAHEEWSSYVDHTFVRELGDGTLPKAVFQTYLVQDYLFLIQFARAYALAVYKSRSLADMRAAQEGLSAIMAEMDLHVRLCGRWGLTPEQIESVPEHRATIAYTRYVLDCGMAGDLLDLHVALAPCVIGYAEIGTALAPRIAGAAAESHPYRDWISEYSGTGFQEAARSAREHLDRLAAKSMNEARFAELTAIFAKASRLEADFWQMAFDVTTNTNGTG